MSEKILYEAFINEAIAEPGFDAMANPTVALATTSPDGAPDYADSSPTSTEIAINTAGDTNTTDIAQQAPKTKLAKNSISQSLPYMIGYVQPISSPVSFVFGLKSRSDTLITQPVVDGESVAPRGEDEVITRKLVTTEIREIEIDMTNEVIQDIDTLFGEDFRYSMERFEQSGGEVYSTDNQLERFFVYLGLQKMTAKINKDFVDWIDTVATLKGTAVIADYTEMENLYGVLGELREALYKSTHKSGSTWALVSPRIAGFLASSVGSRMSSGADVFEQGRIKPNNQMNGYVMTLGDMDVYQYDFLNDVTGGESDTTEATGEIYVGFTGGPDVSSVYYSPYKEYIVQGGEDYYSGQSSVFYRVRDAWNTNPLDTYNISTVTSSDILEGTDPTEDNKSQYIVKAAVTFTTSLLS